MADPTSVDIDLPAAAPARAENPLKRLARWLGDVVMPPVCLACREPLLHHETLCAACWQTIEFIRPPLCDRLGIPLPYATDTVMISAAAAADPPSYARARAAARFGGVVRDLVHDLKFNDRLDVRHLLGRWIAEAGRELLAGCDAVIPVPLARWRLIGRRFNQAAVIGQEAARLANVGFAPELLARTRTTRQQVGLTARQRRENVATAFAVPLRLRPQVEGRRLLLVDDVITTGATVEACARALLKAGAAHVDVLAVAMVTDPSAVEA